MEDKGKSTKIAHSAIALIWAAIMIVATFAVDDAGPLIAFWLLVGAYLIVKNG